MLITSSTESISWLSTHARDIAGQESHSSDPLLSVFIWNCVPRFVTYVLNTVVVVWTAI